MKKTARFLIISILLIATCLLNSKSLAFAQSYKSYSQPINNPDVPQNLHTYSQNVLIEVMSAAICQITGVDIINPSQPCLGIDFKTQKIGFSENNQGLIGVMGNLIAITINPPIHFYDYSSYLASNFGFAKNVYAENNDYKNGVGYSSLKPLLNMWSTFRDIAYYILVVVFVFIGIAIILRVKIDPRTVMSIQNQIPKIIMAIIFITFSFAIAGILIDLMWVSIYLILNIFGLANPSLASAIPRITSSLTQDPLHFLDNVFSAWGIGLGKIAWNAANSVGDIIRNLLGYQFEIVEKDSESGIVNFLKTALNILNTMVNPLQWLKLILSGIIQLAAFFIFSIALLIVLIKIWFMLLMAYASIVIDVIFAPFWIIGGLLPGTKRGVGGWLRHLMSKILVFPTVITMFLIANIFMDVFKDETYLSNFGAAPLLGLTAGPQIAAGLISIGIIFMTPKAAKWMEEAFKALTIDLSPIGAAIGAGSRPFASGAKYGWKRLWDPGDPYFHREAGALRKFLYTQTPKRFGRFMTKAFGPINLEGNKNG
jgi:hypothetical protein